MTAMEQQQDQCLRPASRISLDIDWDDLNFLSPIQACPNDLLLQIAAYLDGPSRRSLSLVSRRFSGIAEDKLYRNISLRHPVHSRRYRAASDSYGMSPISRLVRTLTKKPNVAAKVRRLQMYPVAQLVLYEQEDFPGIPSKSRVALPKVDANISEARLAGLLLTLVPHLEALDLTVYDNWPSSVEDFPSGCSIKQLFDDDADTYQHDLSAIPGLQSLKLLVFNSERFDWPWCRLPNIKHLVLGGRAIPEIPTEHSPLGVSSIPKLTISTYSCVFLSDPHMDHEILPPFLERFPNLRTLVFSIRDAATYLTDSDPGRFDNLIDLLASTAGSLEELRFGGDMSAAYLDFIYPVSRLSHFHRLRMLELTQDALLGSRYPFSTLSFPSPIHKLLPPSLEQLNVWHPRLTIYDWFEELLDSILSVPSLNKVELLCTKEHGDCWEVIENTTHKHPATKRLGDAGIYVKVRFIEWRRTIDWTDEQYDLSTMDFFNFR